MSNPFFTLLHEPESFISEWQIDEAWRQWEMASCVERHGEHLWWMETDVDEADGTFDLYCSYCPARVDDIYPDGMGVTFGQAGSWPIEDGLYLSSQPFSGPVRVELITKVYNYPHLMSPEYDVWIEVCDA